MYVASCEAHAFNQHTEERVANAYRRLYMRAMRAAPPAFPLTSSNDASSILTEEGSAAVDFI
eukprot:5663279-Amphidinium_carterae.2